LRESKPPGAQKQARLARFRLKNSNKAHSKDCFFGFGRMRLAFTGESQFSGRNEEEGLAHRVRRAFLCKGGVFGSFSAQKLLF